jgi:hypothetical protein
MNIYGERGTVMFIAFYDFVSFDSKIRVNSQFY